MAELELSITLALPTSISHESHFTCDGNIDVLYLSITREKGMLMLERNAPQSY